MRRRNTLDIVSICLVLTLTSTAAHASITALSSHHSLICGKIRYHLTDLYASDATIGHQTMRGRRPNGSEFSIDLRNRDEKLDGGITATVAEWLCVQAPHHTFIELLYSCNIDMTNSDVDRYCRGSSTSEWVRYIGLDGQPLDRGFKTDDPRYDELRRHLGIFGNRRIRMQEEKMAPVD